VHGTGAPEDVWNEQVRPRPCSISSLKILDSEGNFDKLFIEYAPNLEWLFGEYMYLRGASKGV
jgi:hypothetical protein